MSWTTPRTWVGGEVLDASIFNTHVRDNIAWQYTGTGWSNVSGGVGFQNSWVDYGSPFTPTRYKKAGDIVEIQGLVKLGARPATIFTLPAGYRPIIDLIFASRDAGAASTYSELRVNTDGTVVCQVGANNAFFSVSCVFVADA